MIEHDQLVKEFEMIYKMSDRERIVLAQKRRQQQKATYHKYMKRDSISKKSNVKNRARTIKFTSAAELLDAAAVGSVEDTKNILTAGADPNEKNHEGLTALHQACIDGSVEIVQLLIKFGADVNCVDHDMWTPLHAAATCGHLKVVELLIKAGGNLAALNGDGEMPYEIAEDDTIDYIHHEMRNKGLTKSKIEDIKLNNYTILKRDINKILDENGDLEIPVTTDGATFLHICTAYSYNDLVRTLLENGASDKSQDQDGWRPIHVAAYWGNIEAIDILLEERNTDLRALTNHNEMPHALADESDTKTYILKMIHDRPEKYSFEKGETDGMHLNNNILNPISKDDLYEKIETNSITDDNYNEGTDEYISEDQIKNDLPLQILVHPDAIEQPIGKRNSISKTKKDVTIKRTGSLERRHEDETSNEIDSNGFFNNSNEQSGLAEDYNVHKNSNEISYLVHDNMYENSNKNSYLTQNNDTEVNDTNAYNNFDNTYDFMFKDNNQSENRRDSDIISKYETNHSFYNNNDNSTYTSSVNTESTPTTEAGVNIHKGTTYNNNNNKSTDNVNNDKDSVSSHSSSDNEEVESSNNSSMFNKVENNEMPVEQVSQPESKNETDSKKSSSIGPSINTNNNKAIDSKSPTTTPSQNKPSTTGYLSRNTYSRRPKHNFAPIGSNLAELKEKRRAQRREILIPDSTSTWYKPGHDTNTTFTPHQDPVEAPPSPTMIKYRFVQPSDTVIDDNLFKNKKCVIM